MNESVEDLRVGGLKIYQSKDGFRFGTDAVFLAWFCRRKKFRTAVDLCSGNGIIPVLLSLSSPAEVTGIELQPEQCELFKKTAELNGLTDIIRCVNADIRTLTPKTLPADSLLKAGKYDLVSVNPPYFETDRCLLPSSDKLSARTEETCTLKDTVAAAACLLRHGGRLCMVHRPERLADIFGMFRAYGIEPKELIPIMPGEWKKPELVLVEGRKGGGKGLLFMPPVVITDSSGAYTPQVCEIYGFDKNAKANDNPEKRSN